jgi:uncharacterized protein
MSKNLLNLFNDGGPVKCVLAITQRCNLACNYCYVQKDHSVMPLSTARMIINLIFENFQKNEKIDIGFFGGEPLLQFNLIKEITDMIQAHEFFDPCKVVISLTTNGTIFSEDIADFLIEKNVILNISCDGPPEVQDAFRHFPDGSSSSKLVERNIRRAVKLFPLLPVNAVYSPGNLHLLPDVVDYLSSLGVRNIYLNPNISARWTKNDADKLLDIYSSIGEKYLEFYRRGEPRYISLIDSKIALILRGGYRPTERCRMGNGEFAFAPSGNVYPCERLIGPDDGKTHCLGNINDGFIGSMCKAALNTVSNTASNRECSACGLREYCMNWCGCTNYYSTGKYDVVSPFICASEKAAINVAFQLIQNIGDNWLDFEHHLAGTPLMNIINEVKTLTQTG